MVVLIPAYEPDTRLVELVRQLHHHTVVVVDDGSGPAYSGVFAKACALGATLVTLEHNCGKGRALKTGFAYIDANFPGQDVICADSDGQHTVVDIDAVGARVAETGASMVLGARRFTGEVPARSKFGNSMTRAAYTLATGQRLLDTQTGLRAYPASMLGWLCEVRGERFEYELRLLLQAAKEGLRIEEVEIATIYLEDNASSHFRPLRDSLRVYGPVLAFTASSMLAFAIDTIALLIFAALSGSVVLAAVGARLISATVNYGVNRVWVFRSGSRTAQKTSAPRYAALALTLFAANVLLLKCLVFLTGHLLVAKAITEASLFVVSYLVQKHLVFAQPGRTPARTDATPAATPPTDTAVTTTPADTTATNEPPRARR